MNYDMKIKLEENFEPLQKLVEDTGIPEHQLLPLTVKILNEQMDMYM